MHSTQENGGMK